MNSFYFVITNPDVEPLLKEEVRLRYPELKLSYSRPGFISFKGEIQEEFNPIFARLSGKFVGKFPAKELSFSKAWAWSRDPELKLPEELVSLSESSLFRIGETVTLIMKIEEDEYWVGEYKLRRTHFQTPGEVSPVIERDDVPSRAYYKIAEAYEALDIPFDNQEVVLELGSAPGGASLFLLEQDMRVLGVDPADMDERVKKFYDFKHLRMPFERITPETLKQEVDWIVSDINLPPTVVTKEVFRLLTFIEPKGILLTLKMNDQKHLELIAGIRQKMRNKGFDRVELKYLPSHRKEVALMALRS